MVMIINQQPFHTPVLWDLFLACSPQCVTAQAFMSAVKCDLKWLWPPLSQLGQEVFNVGLTGVTVLRTRAHTVTTGAIIIKKDQWDSLLTLVLILALWCQDPGTLLNSKSSWYPVLHCLVSPQQVKLRGLKVC